MDKFLMEDNSEVLAFPRGLYYCRVMLIPMSLVIFRFQRRAYLLNLASYFGVIDS